MVSFIKIGPFLNSAALGGLGGKMAAPGRRRQLERAAWCQNVRTNILVTGKKMARLRRAVFEQSKIVGKERRSNPKIQPNEPNSYATL